MFNNRLSSFDDFFQCHEAIGNLAQKETKKMESEQKI